MKRGEVWTVAGGADYAGKPRPVVILQDDSFGTVNGRGQVRIPTSTTVGADFETIPVTLSTN
jgi:mRNA interferase MazF